MNILKGDNGRSDKGYALCTVVEKGRPENDERRRGRGEAARGRGETRERKR